MLFEPEDVLESGALEFCVGHGGDVDQGGGFGVGASFAAAGGELVADEGVPPVFVLHCYGLDHDLHQVRAILHADDVEDAAFCFSEKSFDFSIGI